MCLSWQMVECKSPVYHLNKLIATEKLRNKYIFIPHKRRLRIYFTWLFGTYGENSRFTARKTMQSLNFVLNLTPAHTLPGNTNNFYRKYLFEMHILQATAHLFFIVSV